MTEEEEVVTGTTVDNTTTVSPVNLKEKDTRISNDTCCIECNTNFTKTGCFPSKTVPCYNCQQLLCIQCSNKYPLVPYDNTKPDIVTKDTQIQSFCYQCFQNQSTINFDCTYDIVEGGNGNSDNDSTTITFVMVHGGGGSRMMFRAHAEELAQKYGYRSILLDLPGHGSKSNVPLTLDACVETVQSVYTECNLNTNRTIYVGGSLGAYIGFYILSKLTNHFIGSILIDCGQNVGPDASLKATLGCHLLKFIVTSMSSKGLMSSMMNVVSKSQANYNLIRTSLGAGMFFQQGIEQINCMHTVKPADYIPHYTFPILFMNGSKDYRDSEQKWLQLCQNQQQSLLHVYDDGDHFFTHDSRFVPDIIQRFDSFTKSIIQ